MDSKKTAGDGRHSSRYRPIKASVQVESRVRCFRPARVPLWNYVASATGRAYQVRSPKTVIDLSHYPTGTSPPVTRDILFRYYAKNSKTSCSTPSIERRHPAVGRRGPTTPDGLVFVVLPAQSPEPESGRRTLAKATDDPRQPRFRSLDELILPIDTGSDRRSVQRAIFSNDFRSTPVSLLAPRTLPPSHRYSS